MHSLANTKEVSTLVSPPNNRIWLCIYYMKDCISCTFLLAFCMLLCLGSVADCADFSKITHSAPYSLYIQMKVHTDTLFQKGEV